MPKMKEAQLLSDILDLQKKIRDILMSDTNLKGIKFYMGYNKNTIPTPLTGVHACIFINKFELTEPTAQGLLENDRSGYVGSFEAEIKIYNNMSSGSILCLNTMGKISQALMYVCSQLDVTMDRLYIIPVKYDSTLSAVTGSVVFGFSALAFKEE